MTTPVEPEATRVPPGQGAGMGGGSFLTQRYGPLPGWGWIAVIALAAGGYILWRRSKTASSNPATTAPATTASGAASAGTTTEDNCTDASGNAVPCTQADYASQIAALQAEIDNLQGTPSVPSSTVAAGTSSTGTGASTPTTGATTTSTGGVAPVTTTPAVTVPQTTPGTTTAT